MPIFEYRCGECGKVSEFLEIGGKKTERKCAHCGSRKLKRQLSTFAARVKEGASKKCFGCTDGSCPHSGGI